MLGLSAAAYQKSFPLSPVSPVACSCDLSSLISVAAMNVTDDSARLLAPLSAQTRHHNITRAAMAPAIEGQAGEDVATRKRDACQAGITPAAGQIKKHGEGKPGYLNRMKQSTAAATSKTPHVIPRASDALAGFSNPVDVPMPPALASRLGAPSIIIGIDIDRCWHNCSNAHDMQSYSMSYDPMMDQMSLSYSIAMHPVRIL